MQITLTFPGCHRRGGIERVVFETANFLVARGHDVQLIASEVAPELDPRVMISRVSRGRWAPAELLHFRYQAKKIIRSGSDRVLAVFGAQAPDDGVFWVPSVHGRWIDISKKHRHGWDRWRQLLNPFHPIALHLERRYFRGRRYRRLIALSYDVKRDLIELYDVPPGDIEVLPNGFAPLEFNTGTRKRWRAEIRDELGYQPADRVIIFVANELDRKGFAQLMRAIARLNRPDVKLLVVGRVVSDRFEAEMDRLGVRRRIRFVGPTADIARYYAAADLFALPTEYEAWGLVIVEAMACGLPVLTSRLAGAAIAVDEGVTGELLDDPRSVDEILTKLIRLLDRQVLDPEFVSASVQHLAWPRILEKYEQILLQHGMP